jgi:predicted nucleotidyltransferase
MQSDDIRKAIPEVVACLQDMAPLKIILFGSHARGAADAESDMDLLVVTQRDEMPQTYREKEDIYLEVARRLREIRRKVPVDLIVHTRPMHDRFIEMGSQFAREVLEEGIVLYESHNP